MNYIKRIPLTARRAVRLTPVFPLPHRRAFIFTSCARAQQLDDTIYNNLKTSSTLRKLVEKPEALAALRDFATLLKEKGQESCCASLLSLRI